MMTVSIETHVGQSVVNYLPDFVRLSEVCLAGWPFFVKKAEGKAQKLTETLRPLWDELHAVIVKDGTEIVGGTYGHPVPAYYGQIAENLAKFHDISRIYWIAQTTILPDYQGRGISHQIYNARDPWIIASGKYDAIAHVLIARPDDHPLRPADHVPYDVMWGKRGYRHLVGFDVKSVFADSLDHPKKPTEKTMQIWLKDLK